MPITVDGTLGVGEGIETSLAGATIFGVPAWAALSAGNMRIMAFPPGLQKLLIFADKGDAGEGAADELCRRAIAAGIDAWMVLPHGGDDFAHDLQRGERRAGDYRITQSGIFEAAKTRVASFATPNHQLPVD
jgi:putative DNA primase/helicase